MIKKILLLAICFLSYSLSLHASQGQELLDQAKREYAKEYEFALENKAEIVVSKDQKTFYVFWKPENYSAQKTPHIVSVHGHGSWTLRDFYMWHSYVKERGYAILCVQWWKGTGETIRDYLTPSEIYSVIDDFYNDRRILAPSALHGFSRGSANSYALAGLDVSSGNRFFDVFIANSGHVVANYPPNREMVSGKFGLKPLDGTRWITVAGGKDLTSGQSAIPAMQETKKWIESYGGKVVLAIEDSSAGHGVFHKVPGNVKLALDKFEEILKK